MNIRKWSFVFLLSLACTLSAMQKQVNFSDQEYKVYCQARKLIDLFFEAGRGVSSLGVARDSVNPYYRFTEQGLILECSSGLSVILWTPWGYCDFVDHDESEGDGKGLLEEVLKHITVSSVDIKNERYRYYYSNDACNSAFAIESIDNVDLPKTRLGSIKQTFEGDPVAMNRLAKWHAMKLKYDNEAWVLVGSES